MTALMLRAAELSRRDRCPEDGVLELLFQPEVDLAGGGIVGMEALLRWYRDAALPTSTEPAATGGGSPMAHWVLAAAAAEAAVWQQLPGGTRHLWLDVSAAQVREPGYPDLVAAVVAEHGLRSGALGLELGEAAIGQLGADAPALLHELRGAGVVLAVDDVCGGPGSSAALAVLPLSVVKLGRRLVRGLPTGAATAARLVHEAHEHGRYVVAEGVETGEEAARLAALGCDRAYGWLFASPQRADKARWMLGQGSGWAGSAVTRSTRAIPLPGRRTA